MNDNCVNPVTNPTSEKMLEWAASEPPKKQLITYYGEAIKMLQSKGFNQTETIEWLEDRGAGRYSIRELSKHFPVRGNRAVGIDNG